MAPATAGVGCTDAGGASTVPVGADRVQAGKHWRTNTRTKASERVRIVDTTDEHAINFAETEEPRRCRVVSLIATE